MLILKCLMTKLIGKNRYDKFKGALYVPNERNIWRPNRCLMIKSVLQKHDNEGFVK